MQRALAEPTPAALRKTHPETCQVDVAYGHTGGCEPSGRTTTPRSRGGPLLPRLQRRARRSGPSRQRWQAEPVGHGPLIQGPGRCPGAALPAPLIGHPGCPGERIPPGSRSGSTGHVAPSPGDPGAGPPRAAPALPFCPATAGQLSPGPAGTPGAGKAPGRRGRSPTCGLGAEASAHARRAAMLLRLLLYCRRLFSTLLRRVTS